MTSPSRPACHRCGSTRAGLETTRRGLECFDLKGCTNRMLGVKRRRWTHSGPDAERANRDHRISMNGREMHPFCRSCGGAVARID